jgi:pyridoxine 4-dehydrogenase
MRITGPGIWGPPVDRTEAIATLRRAVELGITFIDTAESYGPHVSETILAEALHPYPGNLVIATKAGLDRPGPDQWAPNGRPERLKQSLEGSLVRLRLERIDLFQLHRIDPNVPEAEQFGFFQEQQRTGRIRHIGLSEVDVPAIQRAQKFFRVVSVQNRFNIGDRRWEPVLAYCEREGIAFIPWAPLEAGETAKQGTRQFLRRALGRAPKRNGAVERFARRVGATPAQIALAWLLHRSPVMLLIPGTSRRTHLEENAAAAQIHLTPADVIEIESS